MSTTRVHRLVWAAGLLCLCMAGIGARAIAQQPEMIAENRVRPQPLRAEELLARPVTVAFDKLSLKGAVNAIATSAGIRVYYRSDLLDAVEAPITLRVKQVPLGVALDRVLAGTHLEAVVLTPNVVTIRETVAGPVQAHGVIAGKVTSAKSKTPVVNASVSIDDAAKGVVTNEDGSFQIPVSTGDHVVHVRALGMTKQSLRVVVPENQTVMANFALEQSASVLSEVVVTGSVVATERKSIATPITVITADDIEKRNITRVDQLFRGEVPGMIALERGTSSYSNYLGVMSSSLLYSRGSASLDGSANPIKTYVDGVEIVDPSYLGTIDPKSIERIEIVTGPQAATIYGSGAMGGVMQIFTKKGNGRTSPDFTLNLRYGALQNNFSDSKAPSHQHGLSMQGGNAGLLNYAGTVSYGYTGQWRPGLYARTFGSSLGATYTTGPIVTSGAVSLTNGLNGTVGTTGHLVAALGCQYGCSPLIESVLRENGDFRPGGFDGIRSSQISTQSSLNLSLNVDYRTTSIIQQHATIGRSQTNFGIEPTAPLFRSYSDTLYAGAVSNGQRYTANYNATFAPRLGVVTSTIILGTNGSWGGETRIDGCTASKTASAYIGCYGGTSAPMVNKSIDSKNWGGFGTFKIGLFDQLFVTLGLRGERNPNYGSNHAVDWTPTNGIAYTMELGELTMKVLGSYGSSTRPPTTDQRMQITTIDQYYIPSQYISQFAAPNLKPEHSRGPQGGIELYYGNLGSLTLNHYKQLVTDLIQSVPIDTIVRDYYEGGFNYPTPQVQSQNVATVRQQGWEGTASITVGPLSLKGTYSWNDSRVRSVNPLANTTYSPGDAFYRLPTHTGNVLVGFARGGLSATWTTSYVGSSLQYGFLTVTSLYRDASNSRFRTYLPRIRSSGGDIATPGYYKSDVGVSQRLTAWASATLNVTNVGNDFGSDNSELFPSLGRQTFVGLSMRFPRGQ